MKSGWLLRCCFAVGVVWLLQGAVGPGGASSAAAACASIAGSVDRMKCEVRQLLVTTNQRLKEGKESTIADVRMQELLKAIDSLCRDISLKILELSKQVQSSAQMILERIQKKIERLRSELERQLKDVEAAAKESEIKSPIDSVFKEKITTQMRKVDAAVNNLRTFIGKLTVSGLSLKKNREFFDTKVESARDNMSQLAGILQLVHAYNKTTDTTLAVVELTRKAERVNSWEFPDPNDPTALLNRKLDVLKKISQEILTENLGSSLAQAFAS